MILSKVTKAELIAQIKKLEREITFLDSTKSTSSTKIKLPQDIRLRSFYKNSLNIITVSDIKGRILYVNRIVKGLKRKNVIGSSIYNFVPEENRSFLKKKIATVLKTGKGIEYKITAIGPNKQLSNYSCTITPVIENKKTIALIVDSFDITNETKIKNELTKSEEKFKNLSDSAFEGIFFHKNGKIVQINKAITKLFNCTEKEIMGKSIFQFIAPSYHQMAKEKLKKKDEKIYEMVLLKKNKQPFWAELVAREIEYHNERARVVAIRDITKNKDFQEQIRKSQELYKRLIDASPDGMIIHQNGKLVFANPSALKLMEVPKSYKILEKSIFSFILPEYIDTIKKRIGLIVRKRDVHPIEIQIKTYKKKIKTIEVRSFLTDYNGKSAIQVIFHDQSIQKQLLKEQIRVQIVEESNKDLQKEIEEKKLAQEKVYAQSAKLNAIIESSEHIIWTLDKNACLISFNKNYEKYIEKNYGLKPDVGMSIISGDAIISSPEHNNFWIQKIYNTFQGNSQHFETKLVNKQGNEVWLEIFLNPIKVYKGKPLEISGIAHDISKKKEAEELINQSLQEKEILLKEVHHRVKNNLQLVSSILNLQSSYVKDEKILNVLKDSQNRIKSMSFIHESLYQTKNFSNINFSEYVTELSENLVHSYSNYEDDVMLKLDIQNVFLNLDLAIPCGLIINEILSNALKYAFVEKTEKKELKVEMIIEKDNLILLIGDNGRGLPKEIDFKNTNSLGLQIVTTLVEQLNGTIELDTINKGTNYIVRFKHNQIKNRI